MNKDKCTCNSCIQGKKFIELISQIDDKEITDFMLSIYEQLIYTEEELGMLEYSSTKQKQKVIKLLRGIWFSSEEDTVKLAQENGFNTSAYNLDDIYSESYNNLIVDVKDFLAKKATEELTQDG